MRLDTLNPPYEGIDAERLAKFMPPESGIPPLQEVRMLVKNHPDLAEEILGLAWFFMGPKSSLSARIRELAIARTCARHECEYEWGLRLALLADQLGFTPEQQAATVHGSPDDAAWASGAERSVLRAVDELCDTHTLSDETWAVLADDFSGTQILEITMLTGWYGTLSLMINAAQLPLESFGFRYPAPAPAPVG